MKKKPGRLNKLMTIKRKIRTGDRVVAISGNSKGLMGIVQSCSGDKVVVQGLATSKKHVKKTQAVQKGAIIDIEKPIHISALKVCVEGDTAAKLKVRKNEHGDRELIYKRGDQEMVYRSVKKPK